jgi:hypothetical protein
MTTTDTTDTILLALSAKLGLLRRARDPVRRNQLAVELLDDFRPALGQARRQAAQDAVAAGIRPAEYARAIGVSRGAVDHLLHR